MTSLHGYSQSTTQGDASIATEPSDPFTGSDKPPSPRPHPRTTRKVLAFFAAGVLGAASLATVGVAPRLNHAADLEATTSAVEEARRTVNVARPARSDGSAELRLPASTAPLQSTVIYARTNGYIKKLHVDIGDHVRAGDLLAEIEAPETDEDLRQARATLEQERANVALAQQRLTRIQTMFKEDVASTQEIDDAQAEYNVRAASLKIAQALVARLEKEQSYQQVVAPFDGIIAQRNVEVGSLITSGSGTTVTSLFRIEQSDTLKVFVDVPQNFAPSVSEGQAAAVEVKEFPGRRFEGKVIRTAGSVDPQTRTLRTEIHLPNPSGELLAGMYAQVLLSLRDPRDPLRVPAASVVFDAKGPQVVSVDDRGLVARRSVTLGRDFGIELEVVGGLSGTEQLVLNPRDDLRDGQAVVVAQPVAPTATASR